MLTPVSCITGAPGSLVGIAAPTSGRPDLRNLLPRLPVPAPALFLIAAAVAADLVPQLGGLSIRTDQAIVTVALVVILFEGGMQIGWARLRPAVAAVVWVGLAGTAVTAAAMAGLAYYAFGFDWRAALLVGAALAPTDPAVVFSVLGKREIAGRSGTLLEGESGANDPVGIALMVSLLAAHGASWSAVGLGAGRFGLQLGVGLVFGAAGGLLLLQVVRRLRLPFGALYPALTMAVAGGLYAATAALDGSGFLAVFIAGIVVGDAPGPVKRKVARFAGTLAGLAEVVAFVVLGLSVEFTALIEGSRLWPALGMAALLIVVVRPLFVGALLAPVRLPRGERLFVLFAGLKGAVPILLGTYVLVEGVARAGEIYDIIFVVVLVSVIVQGGLVPTMIRLWRVPIRGST
ncbi:MAG: potassium/hydrogen antiporter [Pseudonocardiales bacterium]|nr:potassium/hydrogen antiporter [Pseudonocardiales bacterium]